MFVVTVVLVALAIRVYVEQYNAVQDAWRFASRDVRAEDAGLIWQNEKEK